MLELLSSAVLSLLLSLGVMPSTPPKHMEALAVTTTTVATHNTLYGSANLKPLADVIGWQEVNTDEGHSKLGALEYYDHYHPGENRLDARNSIPISWRKNKYEKTGDGSRLTHGGEAGVTPSRFVNWVVLKNKDTGAKLAFINTHYISGAWNGEHPERQERWRTHNDVVREVVAELLGRGQPGGVGQQHRALGVDEQRGRGQRVQHGLDDDGRAGRGVRAAADVHGQLGLARSSSHVRSCGRRHPVRGNPSFLDIVPVRLHLELPAPHRVTGRQLSGSLVSATTHRR